MFTKKPRYFFDYAAMKAYGKQQKSVWTLPTQSYNARAVGFSGHHAVFPEALVEPMILAGSRPGDTVLDPFLGSGTTLVVARRLGRSGIGIELQPNYMSLARHRLGLDNL